MVIVLAISICLFWLQPTLAETTLKLQCIYPLNGIAGQTSDYFAKKAKEYTGGEVEIKVYGPGQLSGAKELLTAVQRGMIDIGIASLLYYSGTVKEAFGTYLPFSWTNSVEALEFWESGYLDFWKETSANYDFYYLAPVAAGRFGIMTKTPIKKLEDMKGQKLRAAGMLGAVAEKLGATPVNLAPAEQYIALQRGTIDGLIFPIYSTKAYRLHEVISYVTSPPIYAPGFVDIFTGKRTWEKLSKENRMALEKAAIEAMYFSFIFCESQDYDIAAYNNKHGVQTIELSKDEQQRFYEATKGLYDEHAQRSENCAKQVKLIQDFLKSKN
jgi:TRAP-type C4-dicarboxylate transport system substrate-binding protein